MEVGATNYLQPDYSHLSQNLRLHVSSKLRKHKRLDSAHAERRQSQVVGNFVDIYFEVFCCDTICSGFLAE